MLILVGGQSHEYDVSVMSGRAVYEAASRSTSLQVKMLVISREGRWLSEGESQQIVFPEITESNSTDEAVSGGPPVLAGNYDIVFSLILGGGSVQGLLEMVGVPYVGCGVLGTALCMDKPSAKEIISSQNIPIVRHVAFTREAYLEDVNSVVRQIKQLKDPWFVKPANLGSSLGISKVNVDVLLDDAIQEAMRYDRRIIIEEALHNPREFEVAIMGNHQPHASPVGEVIYNDEFYDYTTKYTAGKAYLQIPANISPALSNRVQAVALQAYQLLDCAGLARVDFFYDPQTEQLYFNEVNSNPAFTPFSAFPKLMKADGYDLPQIIETAVELGIERHSLKTASCQFGSRSQTSPKRVVDENDETM